MKYIALTLLIALYPSVCSAYFVDYTRTYHFNQAPQFIPEIPVNHPNWPSWIGRLDALANFFYNRDYEQLTNKQRQYLMEVTEDWPSWIGVPFRLPTTSY